MDEDVPVLGRRRDGGFVSQQVHAWDEEPVLTDASPTSASGAWISPLPFFHLQCVVPAVKVRELYEIPQDI